ncbi:hypothetical protein M9Y10_037984 [Tritrichomonas musculus]|uniref:THAP9-like helix-turn-helix domain-containing protein n=1 Tax=Tritrichomonas musculus TaxID=1915356 RepID=A0ABR2K768_9EUKA
MDLVQRLFKGKHEAKQRRERNKYKLLYFRFCKTNSSDESDPYSDYSESDDLEEDQIENISNDPSESVSSDQSANDIFQINQDSIDYCAKIDLQNKKIRQSIITNIFNNVDKGNGARYTEEAKLFSYNLFCKSPDAYSYLRSLFPFPSESILHEIFNSAVSDHKKRHNRYK